jgi:hypothetical protein
MHGETSAPKNCPCAYTVPKHTHACACMHMYITYMHIDTHRYTCACTRCITRIYYYSLLLFSSSFFSHLLVFLPSHFIIFFLHLGLASMKSESPNVRSLVKALVPLVKKCPSMTANDVRSAMYGLQGMHSSSKEGNSVTAMCFTAILFVCICLFCY